MDYHLLPDCELPVALEETFVGHEGFAFRSHPVTVLRVLQFERDTDPGELEVLTPLSLRALNVSITLVFESGCVLAIAVPDNPEVLSLSISLTRILFPFSQPPCLVEHIAP